MADHIHVDLADRSYDVCLEEGFDALPAKLDAVAHRGRVMLVSERTVDALYGDAVYGRLVAHGLEVQRIVIAPGEHNKTLENWQDCVRQLLAHRIDRKTPVIALGGGVLGDIAGFAAASVLRGVPFVQVPTTLLAMVDSSVGGKTGVNHPAGKNLVGAFHQPSLVFANVQTLRTLEAHERIAGLGEVVKTALLGDAAFLDWIEANAGPLRAGQATALMTAIRRCVRIKAEVVAEDEREAGRRAILNAGHTVGHGVEAALGYGVMAHGAAVALGLVAEARWAVARGYCSEPGLPDRLHRLCGSLGLPTAVPVMNRDEAARAMRLDKKVVSDKLTIPVPVRAGEMVLRTIPLLELDDLMAFLP